MVKVKAKKTRPTEAEFMAQPLLWPKWPFLPVKRQGPDGRLECGLLESSSTTSVIKGGNLWDLKAISEPIDPAFPSLAKLKADLPRYSYDSIEAMIADGWRAD